VDEFCALPSRADIEAEIQAAERNLAAAREQDPVRRTPAFDALALPALDIAAVERVLQDRHPIPRPFPVFSHSAVIPRGRERGGVKPATPKQLGP
jgi:hypothetical protein